MYVFDFDTNLSLNVGETYWFGLHLSSDFDRDDIYWECGDLTTNYSGYESEYGTFDNWYGNTRYHAFNLIGSDPVPEPATFILLGSGLAGLAFYRRKKK